MYKAINCVTTETFECANFKTLYKAVRTWSRAFNCAPGEWALYRNDQLIYSY